MQKEEELLEEGANAMQTKALGISRPPTPSTTHTHLRGSGRSKDPGDNPSHTHTPAQGTLRRISLFHLNHIGNDTSDHPTTIYRLSLLLI